MLDGFKSLSESPASNAAAVELLQESHRCLGIPSSLSSAAAAGEHDAARSKFEQGGAFVKSYYDGGVARPLGTKYPLVHMDFVESAAEAESERTESGTYRTRYPRGS